MFQVTEYDPEPGMRLEALLLAQKHLAQGGGRREKLPNVQRYSSNSSALESRQRVKERAGLLLR